MGTKQSKIYGDDKCIITECNRRIFENYILCYLHLVLNGIILKSFNAFIAEEELMANLYPKYKRFEESRSITNFNEDEYKFYKYYCKKSDLCEIIYPFGTHTLFI
jgi:hypothetical protein